MNSDGTLDDHLIDNTVFLRLLTSHIKISIRIRLDPLQRLRRVSDHDPIQLFSKPQDLPRLDVHIRGLSLKASYGLMDENP